MWHLYKNYLSKKLQSVRVKYLEHNVGVLQEKILRPHSLSFKTDDSVMSYADDITLIITGHSWKIVEQRINLEVIMTYKTVGRKSKLLGFSIFYRKK